MPTTVNTTSSLPVTMLPSSGISTPFDFPIPSGTWAGYQYRMIADWDNTNPFTFPVWQGINHSGVGGTYTDVWPPGGPSTTPFTVGQINSVAGTGTPFTANTQNSGISGNIVVNTYQIILYTSAEIGGGGSDDANKSLLSADTYNGIVTVGWLHNQSLRVNTHRGIGSAIGSPSSGWEGAIVLEASNVTDMGLAYLFGGRCYLTYKLGSNDLYRTNNAMGAAGAWSGTAASGFNRISASGRAQGQSWIMVATGTLSANGSLFSYQCRDLQGVTWRSGITIDNAKGPYCGGAYFGHSYGSLYVDGSSGVADFNTSLEPGAGWGTPSTGLFAADSVRMARAENGLLVALAYATGAQTVKVSRSRDNGATWDSLSSSVLTSQPICPAIVAVGNIFYMLYIVSNAVTFKASVDGGLTWV